MKIGYKVVHEFTKNKFMSAVMWGEGALFYELGKVTRPVKGYGPMGVFATLAQARDFKAAAAEAIFKVVYIESKDRAFYTPIHRTRKDSTLRGTRFASKVILVERVR